MSILAQAIEASCEIIGRNVIILSHLLRQLKYCGCTILGITTLDYLLGGSNSAVRDKEQLKRLENIESLNKDAKDKICPFYLYGSVCCQNAASVRKLKHTTR